MLKSLRTPVFMGLALILSFSCARRRPVPSVPPPLTNVQPGYTERGLASWYGEPYHGRRAANGEVYDMRALTAAHLRLPFDTWVDVLNESNGKRTQVRITDRGPFVKGRIIDLSQRAAEDIALIGPGVGPVRLTVIPPPASQASTPFAVQLGAFNDPARATALQRRLLPHHPNTIVASPTGSLHRVLAIAPDRSQAEALQRRLAQLGFTGILIRHVP